MNKTIQLDLDDKEQLALLARALSAEVRIEILRLLCRTDLNINEIAERLNLPQSSAAAHVKVLEGAGLIKTSLKPAVRGSMKVCSRLLSAFQVELISRMEEETEIINKKGILMKKTNPGAFIIRTGPVLNFYGSEKVTWNTGSRIIF